MHEKALSPLNSKSSNDSTLKTTLAKDFNFLKGCALEYKLTGAGFFELCDINAAVAKKFGRMNVIFHLILPLVYYFMIFIFLFVGLSSLVLC